jgi:quinol monooxygenase YgiN
LGYIVLAFEMRCISIVPEIFSRITRLLSVEVETMSQAVNLVRFLVREDQASAFVEQRVQVDKALKSLAGFVNSELLQVSEDQWLLLERWESSADAVAAQDTEGMRIINDWVGIADQVLSFDIATVLESIRSEF